MSTASSVLNRGTISRPQAGEHDPYYSKYIDRVPEGDLIATLRGQISDTSSMLRGVPADRENYAYAPGKWSIKQVVGHVTDAERIFTYRALRISRHDTTDLPGFDENAFVANANFGDRTLGDLVEELQAVRSATIHFAKHLDQESAALVGTANRAPISVRALLYITAGHELHHAGLLRERYLSQV